MVACAGESAAAGAVANWERRSLSAAGCCPAPPTCGFVERVARPQSRPRPIFKERLEIQVLSKCLLMLKCGNQFEMWACSMTAP